MTAFCSTSDCPVLNTSDPLSPPWLLPLYGEPLPALTLISVSKGPLQPRWGWREHRPGSPGSANGSQVPSNPAGQEELAITSSSMVSPQTCTHRHTRPSARAQHSRPRRASAASTSDAWWMSEWEKEGKRRERGRRAGSRRKEVGREEGRRTGCLDTPPSSRSLISFPWTLLPGLQAHIRSPSVQSS